MPTILLNNIRPGGKSLTNLRVGSTEVKYVKRGDGKLFYDTLSHYLYGTPSVSLSYATGNTSAAGGTKSPTLSYSQTKTPVGYSGTNYTASSVTSGATVKYEVTSGSATVNSTSGVVTWPANLTTSERSTTIKVTVTLNGKSNNTTATVKQNGDTVSSSSISLSSNNYTTTASECASGGGSCTITAKVTKTWVSGDTTYDKPSLTSSHASFTIGTINSSYQATGTWAASSSTSRRNTTITATYSGATNKTLTLYQAANTNTTTEYENPSIESVTAADIPAKGGTTDNSYYTVKFYQRKRTKYADGTYSDWSYAYSSGSTATTTMITASTTLTGSNLGTDPVARTKKGSINITVTANGKTSSAKSVDIYQQQNKLEQTSISDFHIPYFGYSEMASVGAGDRIYPHIPSNFRAIQSDRYTSTKYKSTNITIAKSSCTIRFSAAKGIFTVDTTTGSVYFPNQNWNNYNQIDTILMTVTYSGNSYQKQAFVGQRANPPNGKVLRFQGNWREAVITFSQSNMPPSYQYGQEQYCSIYVPASSDVGMGQYYPVFDDTSPPWIYGIDSQGTAVPIYIYSGTTTSVTIYQKKDDVGGGWGWRNIGTANLNGSDSEIIFSFAQEEQDY